MSCPGNPGHGSRFIEGTATEFPVSEEIPELKGGFKMLKCNKNGRNLSPIGDGPLVDGRALKAVTTRNIYLYPIQKDIDLDEETSSGLSSEEDECMEECLVCG